MKRVILVLLLIFLTGCALGAPIPNKQNDTPQDMVVVNPNVKPAQPVAEPEPVEKPEPVVESEPSVELNKTNETTEKKVVLEVTGDTKIQRNLELCPHLIKEFDCNRYDLRACNFKKIMGKNDFYPDYVICHSGGPTKGEVAVNKYCFIQQCEKISEGNIVQKYGGVVAYAEYSYTESKTADGGIMTHYELLGCGETKEQFKEFFDCETYYSKWRDLWD